MITKKEHNKICEVISGKELRTFKLAFQIFRFQDKVVYLPFLSSSLPLALPSSLPFFLFFWCSLTYSKQHRPLMYNSLTLYICACAHVNLLAHNKECFYHSLSIPCASSQLMIFRVSHYSDVHHHRLDLFFCFFCFFFFNSFVLDFFHSILSL